MSSRRKFLAALSTGLAAAAAGCSGGGDETTTTTETTTATTTTEATTTTTTEATTTEATTTETTTTETTTTATTTRTPQDYTLDGIYPTHMATPGRTGEVTSEGPKRGVSKAWESLIDSQNRGPYPPILVDGRLYGTGGSKVSRYNPVNGDRDWQHEFDSGMTTVATVAGGSVYAATKTGLYSLNAETGEQEWQAKQVRTYTAQVRPPVVVDGTVYVVASGTLYAVDAEDGKTNWTEGAGQSAPALGSGMAFVGNDGGLSAISLSEESTAWSGGVPGTQRTVPRTKNGRVFVRSKPVQARPRVFCFDAVSGEQLWEHELKGSGLQDAKISSIGVGAGHVLVGTDVGSMHALAPEDGSQNWRNDLRQGRYYPPTIADGVVYAVNLVDNLVAIDAASGKTLYYSSLPNNCYTPPVVDGDAVYVADKSYVYGLTQ